HRALEPPDPIPNSEVKRCIADGSVGSPHVRVGHRQALYRKPRYWKQSRGFSFSGFDRVLRPMAELKIAAISFYTCSPASWRPGRKRIDSNSAATRLSC